MIRIHTGFLLTEKIPAGGTALESLTDYLSIRQLIAESLSNNRDLEVYVLVRTCDGWFWELNDYYSDVSVIWDAPSERLKRKLSVHTLPTALEMNPELVIDLRLLDLPDPTESTTDVWRWVFQHKLGNVWISELPSYSHLSELVYWYVDQENHVDPVLQPIVERKIQKWINLSSGKLRSAYARFLENPRENAYSLIAWQALSSYDRRLREQWLATKGWYSQKLEDLAEMLDPPDELPKLIRNKLNVTLRTYWNAQFKDRFDDSRL